MLLIKMSNIYEKAHGLCGDLPNKTFQYCKQKEIALTYYGRFVKSLNILSLLIATACIRSFNMYMPCMKQQQQQYE